MSETNRAKEFQRGTAGVPESTKEGVTGLPEGSDIGLGARCREFESPISAQDVLMKDATQKTPHESAVFLYLYWLFSGGKVRKNVFSENQFFHARGDISEMQQSTLADWCDLNTEAKKE